MGIVSLAHNLNISPSEFRALYSNFGKSNWNKFNIIFFSSFNMFFKSGFCKTFISIVMKFCIQQTVILIENGFSGTSFFHFLLFNKTFHQLSVFQLMQIYLSVALRHLIK